MTLNTEVITTTPADPHEVFHKCRELLGATDAHPFKDEPRDEKWHWDDPGLWEIGNNIGIGLNALMWVVYRPGLEPRRTPEESARHGEDCEPGCDGTGWAHKPACWVEIHFDTTYGYHGPEGGCGALHARLLYELGQWFDERHIGWGWQNEFTGDWHYEDHYAALKELCTGGGQAMAWFTEIVQPSIESLLR